MRPNHSFRPVASARLNSGVTGQAHAASPASTVNREESFVLRTNKNKVKVIILLVLVFGLLGTTHINAQSPDVFPSSEEMQKKATEFNKTVTDEEMVKFFELIFRYHPKNIADFQSHSPEERKAFLAMHRDMANEAGIEI